jgi:predicted NBD/HSP70 family sugar kinase
LAEIEGDLAIEDVLAAARSNDPFALSLVRAAGRVHGWVAHQLNELFNPERIIFAGPLADLGEPFLAAVRETACEFSGAGPGIIPKMVAAITTSTLGQYNGAVGAAALAMHEWKPKR